MRHTYTTPRVVDARAQGVVDPAHATHLSQILFLYNRQIYGSCLSIESLFFAHTHTRTHAHKAVVRKKWIHIISKTRTHTFVNHTHHYLTHSATHRFISCRTV